MTVYSASCLMNFK